MRPEKRRHFRAGLREAEDVVDEEQHVLALVAEMLGDREAGQADARARARRLVHLAIDERAFRARLAAALLRILVDARLDHLVIEVVAFAGALADAGEHRIAAMGLGDVVDELHDQHRLADAGAAEQADLAALGIGREEIDDLDAGDEDFRFRRLVDEFGRRLMDGALLLVLIGPASSTGSPMTFMMRPSVSSPTGTVIGAPVSVTSWPRTRPSVESMAMVRTVFSPRCWATSSTSRLPPLSVSSAFRICGRFAVELHVDDGAQSPGVMRPTGLSVAFVGLSSPCVVLLSFGLERFGARNDFDEFLGDLRLALAVVSDRQLVDHVAGIARGVVHGAHARALLRRRRFRAARGKSAPRCCAAGGRRGFRPRRARRHRWRRRDRARLPPLDARRDERSAVGFCDITDLNSAKNSVQTSNSPSSKS